MAAIHLVNLSELKNAWDPQQREQPLQRLGAAGIEGLEDFGQVILHGYVSL